MSDGGGGGSGSLSSIKFTFQLLPSTYGETPHCLLRLLCIPVLGGMSIDQVSVEIQRLNAWKGERGICTSDENKERMIAN